MVRLQRSSQCFREGRAVALGHRRAPQHVPSEGRHPGGAGTFPMFKVQKNGDCIARFDSPVMLYIYTYIWVNYNDLTTTSLEIMVSKGNHPQMALIQVSELL